MQQAGRCRPASVPAGRCDRRRRGCGGRDFAAPGTGASAGAGPGGVSLPTGWPISADLKVNEPIDIAYPDADSPGVLLKLGTAVPGGVGPDGDIVAYSVLCPHKGWLLSYNAGDKTLNCPGHFSRFDCEAGGQQTWGHATQNLPQFKLRVTDAGRHLSPMAWTS